MSTDTAVTTDSTRTVSEARLRANRENAQKSTGPRTPEGKERSRANGLRHGLSGDGIVLPEPMRAEVERLIAAYTEKFQPRDDDERELVRRRALASARSDVAWGIETIFLANASERAESDALWESDREAEAAELGAKLAKRPGPMLAKLKGGLHGVRWLRDRWLCLDVALDRNGQWDDEERRLALTLLGTPAEFLDKDPWDLARSTTEALKELVHSQVGRLDEMEEGDLADQDEARRQRVKNGIDYYGTPELHRIWRYAWSAQRLYEKAADTMARIERQRERLGTTSGGWSCKPKAVKTPRPVPAPMPTATVPAAPKVERRFDNALARISRPATPAAREVQEAPVPATPKVQVQGSPAAPSPLSTVAPPAVRGASRGPDPRKLEQAWRKAKRKAERQARKRRRS
jgi:hypothetical protein